MRILAIDFGTTTGYAIHSYGKSVSGFKAFKAPKKGRKSIPDEHMGKVYAEFMVWLRYQISEGYPSAIVYEEPGRFQSNHARNAIVGFRGILLGIAGHYGIPVYSISPKTLKKYATGNGNSKKDAMVLAAQKKLDPSITDDNQADSRWLLEWFLQTRPDL